MCFPFPRRRGNRPVPKPLHDDRNIGRIVMRLLVDTTTIIAPTHNGHHRQRLDITTKGVDNLSTSDLPNSPIFSIGVTIHSQLEHIFRGLCGRSPTFSNKRYSLPGAPRPTLSREKLAVFLESIQGEMLTMPLEKDRYHFEDFLEVWRYQYSWNASRPPAPPDVLDMSLPISHYFISSSHNTYLSGNQLSSPASIGEYKKVLEGNCRCIEIDVWNPQTRTKSKKSPNVHPKPAQKQTHHRHISSTSMATSIHDSIEAVTSLFASKVPPSRGSSFSQRSILAPAPGDEPCTPKEVDETAAISRLREEHHTRLVDEAIDDADDYIEESQNAPSTEGDFESPQTSQTSQTSQDTQPSQYTSAPIVAQISITAPGADTSVPANVPDETESWGGDEPIVMHAHSFFSKDVSLGTHVPFRDVCRAVKNTAFRTNHMPVIVSLEVHTNAVQQRKMVKIMKEEWGEHLLEAPVAGTDPRLRLPTLSDLRDKILVKVKRPYAPNWTAGGTNATSHSQGISLGASLSTTHQTDAGSTSGSEDEALLSNANASAITNAKITEELGSLAVYTESRHLTKFADRDAKLPSHIFSLSETKIQSLHEKSHEELFHHNKKYMMRAYPNATKHVLSTNPDPACCWRRGVQMVALNWQSLDKAMMLNHGMFEGTHGWILKPPGYRSQPATTAASSAIDGHTTGDSTQSATASINAGPGPDPGPSPGFSLDPVPCPVACAEPTCTLDLLITVFAGQHLPLPPVLERKIKKNNVGKGKLMASTAGIVTGRGHAHFCPVVKCELNVEHAEKRCPETVASSSSTRPSAAKTGTTPLSTPKIPSSAFFASTVRTSTSAVAAIGAPSVRVLDAAVPPAETVNKHRTSASKTDHPHWGLKGETLSFPNITSVVESLSFITFLVEDEGSKDALGLNDTLAGWACIRLDRLRVGYRFVRLMDSHGNLTEGKLLVKIEKKYHAQ